MSFDLSHLIGRELVWLFDFSFAGRTFYLSKDHESVTIDGETFDYHPGLFWGGVLEDQIALLSDAPSPSEVSLTLHLQGLVDVPQAVADGHDLAASAGRLYLWARGSAERLLFIDGRVTDPSYGSKDQPVTLGLEENAFDDTALFPPPLAQVTPSTWPSARESLELERYPWILGFPGDDEINASPGLWVDTDKLLIAGHRTTEGSTVKIYNRTDSSSSSLAVAAEVDGLGRYVTTVDISTMANNDIEDEYWVQWSSAGAGGIATHDGGVCRGAGDVLRFMLEQGAVRWDQGRVSAILPALNRYKIDCAIIPGPDGRFSPLEWVKAHLAPILPISARQGPEGLYWSLFRYDSTAADAIESIDIDRTQGSRDGAVQYSSPDQIANEIRLSYATFGPGDKPARVFVLTGDDDTLAENDEAVSNVACRISRDRFGLRTAERRTEIVYDKTTAAMVCHWLASAFALPSRTIAYTVEQRFGYLAPGDVVTLTDSEIGAAALVCLVDSVSWSEQGSLGLVLRAIDNPARELF
tara:strand:- start:189 stop:1763 length:1575 start_codon:yes stop_codon:yes gene_type:complete